MSGVLKTSLRDLRTYPRSLWILFIATFVYTAGSGLAFPLEGIYLRTHLHASWFTISILFGLLGILASPFQIIGGAVTDRVGRRIPMIVASISGIVWFVGFAFAGQAWQVGVLVVIESALGWPLFLTSSNAMIADVLPQERRANAYGLIRTAMNVGVVLGPAAGGIALGFGLSFRDIFLSAAVGCAGFLTLILIWVEETRPAAARQKGAAKQVGYRLVMRDRQFLMFCAVALLALIPFGQFGAIYSTYITTVMGVKDSTWPLLLALNAGIVAALQFVAIALSRGRNPMRLMAFASLLIAIGVGGVAFAHSLTTLVILVVILSIGEIFFSPIASSVVSDMAPEAIRGRYMGAWTVMWNGGASAGPLLGGILIGSIGGRGAFGTVLVLGLIGAVLFMLLSTRQGQPLTMITQESAPVVRDAERPT
ncbi:MAG: MDR family MFS transporter [Thermoleophilia bacterium]